MRILVTILIIGFVVLCLCGIGYRYFQILPYPIGSGEEGKSPDGHYIAHVTNYYDEDFWGHSSNWYEFELKNLNGRQIRFWRTNPIQSAYFGSRSDVNVVRWESDSSAVRFTFPGIEVIMKPQE